ncbi:hypothetical protein B566_EDAN015508 [Ephemera danica]|nr:hypothetical protein B566_EDAN015508 [Ephemera danica]
MTLQRRRFVHIAVYSRKSREEVRSVVILTVVQCVSSATNPFQDFKDCTSINVSHVHIKNVQHVVVISGQSVFESNTRKCEKSCVPRSTCDFCEKTFVQRSDMIYHQRTSCKGRGIGPRVSKTSVKVECSACRRKFASTKNLYQDRKQHCPARNEQMFSCDKCKSISVSKVSLYKHMQRHLNLEMNSIRCTECDVVVPKKQIQKHKREECVNRNRVGSPISRHSRDLTDGVVVSQTAFNKMLTNYEIENNDDKCDLEVFLERQRYAIEEIIKHDLFVKNAIKMNMALQIKIENTAGETSIWAFRTSNVEIYLGTSIDETITDIFEKIKQKFSERLLDGSGCKLSSIEKLQVRTRKNNPLRASSYLQLPDFISRRLAIINPYNVDDHECFKWSVCASIYKGPHPERTGKLLPFVERFDWTDVKFPSSFEDVRKFECNNPTVSINIYALSTNDKLPEVFPIKVAEKEKNRHIDLLVLENGENWHYAYIKNVDRLLSSQLTNYNGVTLICKRCLSHHYSEEALTIHKKHCSKFPIARIELPQTKVGEDGQPIKPIIAFKNVEHSEKLPIVIYADFESYLPKVQGCVNNPENSSTTVVQEHGSSIL